MATNDHRYFRYMGDWSHSAGLAIRELNFPCRLCLPGSDIVFAAELFVDNVLGCARVDHCIDGDLSFHAV